MKTSFTPETQQGIFRAKEILRHLCKSAELSQIEMLQQLEQQGLSLQQSTLANWLSPKTANVRPKQEYLEPIVRLCRPHYSDEQIEETLDELKILFAYQAGPMSPESVHNQVSQQLNDSPALSLLPQKELLEDHLEALDSLLDVIESRVMDYGLYYPVIQLEPDEKSLAKQLLGSEAAEYRKYQSEEGFVIPLTKIQSESTMIRIIDEINQAVRLLQRYLDRHLNQPGGLERLDFVRLEDYITYAWEISDRLLHHNHVIKAMPVLKRALLRQMTTCAGIRYILQNQNAESSEIALQNLLALKSRDFEIDIHCSVAVFVGMLARQLMRSGSELKIQRALKLYLRAAEWLQKHHTQLNTEQEIYHYKKELANLHYDMANFALHQAEYLADFDTFFQRAMTSADHLYTAVIEQENAFFEGLSSERRQHLMMFYVIVGAWILSGNKAEKRLKKYLILPETFNESYWAMCIAQAISYAVISYRLEQAPSKKQQAAALEYKVRAHQVLNHAAVINGYFERTQQELDSEWILNKILGSDAVSKK